MRLCGVDGAAGITLNVSWEEGISEAKFETNVQLDVDACT